MGSLLQNTQEEGLEYKEDSEMTIVFPNIATNEFIWKKNTVEAESVNIDLEKFLSKPSDIRMPSVSIETKKIRVEWPTILSSDCSTWLSTRKAEANKKQQEKEKAEENKWLVQAEVQGGQKSAVDLARSVREGLLRASGSGATLFGEVINNDVDSTRIPLPITEEFHTVVKTVEPQPQIQHLSLGDQVKVGLRKAGSMNTPAIATCKSKTSTATRPWAPKSLAAEVKAGLLRAGGKLEEKEVDNVKPEEKVSIEHEEQEASPLNSIVDSLRNSLMNITVEKESSSPLKTSISENLRESLLNLALPNPDQGSTSVLDSWIIDDTQSEASIVTLDTVTDSMDMDEYDDFNDMEHELSMWITK